MATLSIATAIDPGARRAAANSQSEIQEVFGAGENLMEKTLVIGNDPAGSVRVTAGGARRRIFVAASPLSLEKRRSLVVVYGL